METSCFETFMAHAPGPAAIKDVDGHYLFLNAQGKQLVDEFFGGLNPEGRPLQAPANIVEQDREVFETGKVCSYVLDLVTERGARWYWWIRFPLTQPQTGERYVGVLGVDVTEWKLAETACGEQSLRLGKLEADLDRAAERAHRNFAAGLHDEVLQLLALARIKTGMVLQGNNSTTDAIRQVHELLRMVELQARKLMVAPVGEEQMEACLERGFNELAKQLESQMGLTIVVEMAGAGEPEDPTLRGLLFRCGRELLMNVAKHAHAKQARLGLTETDTAWALEVVDDGVGFKEPTAGWPQGHFGLLSMTDALNLYGGRLVITHGAKGGTLCRVEIPQSCTEKVAHGDSRVISR